MSFTPHRKPLRMAALVAGVALSASAVGVPSLAFAATTKPVVKKIVKADPVTVVTRLSFAKGPVTGDNELLITGKKLATWSTDHWVPKEVNFGTEDASATALSEDVLRVWVPEAAGTTKEKMAVTVLVGDATKGPKYTYVLNPIYADNGMSWGTAEGSEIYSETGKTGLYFYGDNLDLKTTKVLVGGKSVKFTLDSYHEKATFTAPAGLIGIQDVVVSDSRQVLNDEFPADAALIGFIKYTAKPITITATSTTKAINEAPTLVHLTGTALDLVTTATFGDEKATLKKIDATHVDVTVAKGAAKTATITLSTKYAATAASGSIVRAASAKPTITETTTIGASGGEVTLTGTNLTGLKGVTLTAVVGGKVYKGSKFVVISDTSAKVTFPALPNNAAYKLKVQNLGTTLSDDFAVTVGTVTTTTTTSTTTSAPTTTTTTTEEPTPDETD